MFLLKFCFILSACCFHLIRCADEDLYKLLGIQKTATTREIRQAFKKLALVQHPDKNIGDPNANEKFMKINRAYEILKDDELRKKYDLYGEKGLHDANNQGYQQYQSWNFYHQNFAIYDDDPEIITLSRSDFMQSVDGSNDIWFVNYYSGQCSHCHDLAPNWRELAKQLDGVVRIGAVNCMDDWMLCNEQKIPAFPTLIAYPKKVVYHGEKSVNEMMNFILSFTNSNVYDLNERVYEKELENKKNDYWFISYCLPAENDDEDNNCSDEMILKKLSIMLNGLINVGTINCNYEKNLCSQLKPPSSNVFYKELPKKETKSEHVVIESTLYKEIAQKLMTFLPDVNLLNGEDFENVQKSLADDSGKPWLIQFVSNYQENSDVDLKKINNLLNNEINFGRIDCIQLVGACGKYQITKYPTFILFKRGTNRYEHHYGRQSANDLAVFAKENAFTNVKTLSPEDFPSIIQGDKPVFLDFFAPWCPPCMQLLPQFRKTAKTSGNIVNFGTIDCTLHTSLCEQYNVRSYPTTILFNKTVPHQYHGRHSSEDLSDFIQDILNPTVFILNRDSFQSLVGNKEKGKIWLVDFFASWCGPCQQLAPEWRKLAKKLSGVALVGQVDCVTEARLCQEQGIDGYPHIRLYPSDSTNSRKYEIYNNHMWRDVNSLFQWASNYLPSATTILDNNNFERLVIKSNDLWLVDFYAPWCGHCQVFAPIFEQIAMKLEGKVKCGKVDCQQHGHLCARINIRAYPSIKFYNTKKPNWFGEDIPQQDFNFIINYANAKINAAKSHIEL